MRRCISFRAYKDGEIRTEKLYGRDHIVVPVVALVEGVLQGMNAPKPELALAEEFGKIPQSWDGRPVVMNHPVVNNIPVSASSPSILDSYAFGNLFNTQLSDNKLRTEAWLDVERIEVLGGEIKETVERLQAGEQIEVSTGLFTALEKSQGLFDGKEYSAIWRNIVPDHLAFLSKGVKGACSNEDGCGARVNSVQPSLWPEMRMQCDKDTCTCGCKGTQMNTNSKDNVTFDPVRFITNMIPDGIIDRDVRILLQKGLDSLDPRAYSYVIGFTLNKVIYEGYDPSSGSYNILQRSYNIDSNKVVTLQDDAEPVVMLTSIVPAKDLKSDNSIKSNQKEVSMTDTTEDTAETTTAETTTQSTQDTVATTPTVNSPGEKASQATKTQTTVQKPRTLQEYLADAPAEIRETMESGIRMHNERKGVLIKALKDTGRCKFTNEYLRSLSLEQLESLNELAAVPTFEGRAMPTRTNATEEAPRPIVAFPVKAA